MLGGFLNFFSVLWAEKKRNTSAIYSFSVSGGQRSSERRHSVTRQQTTNYTQCSSLALETVSMDSPRASPAWQNHRITECLGMEGTSVGHLVQPSWRSRVTYCRLHRNLSRQVLNISGEGDSTASLGSLFPCSITLRRKKFFLMFRRNFLCFSLCPLPLVLSLGTTEKSLVPSSWHAPFRYL